MLIKLKKKQGQSTLEYIILVTAVIVIVIGLVVSPTSPFRTTLNKTFNSAITKMDTVGTAWDGAVLGTPDVTVSPEPSPTPTP